MTLSINNGDDNECICSGYIYKAPALQLFGLNWQRKWVELLDSKEVYPLAKRYLRLEVYNDRESRKRFIKPKTIVLCDRASVRYNHQTDMEFALDVVVPNKIYTFSTCTGYELEQWFCAIDCVIDHATYKQKLNRPAAFTQIPTLDNPFSLPSTPPGSKAQGQMMLPRLCNQGPNRTTTVNQGYEGLPGMPFNPHGHEKKINKFSHQIKFFQPRPKPQVDQLLGEEESRDTLQPINGSYVLSNRTTIVSNRSSNVRNQPRYKPQHMLRRKEQVHSPDFLSNTLRTTSYTNLLEEEIVDEFTAFGK